MKISNITSRKGNKVPNQFIMSDSGHGANGNYINKDILQSYDSVIATITRWNDRTDIVLDSVYWNYSRTTSKYLSIFLNESKKDIMAKVANGTYKLTNLN